ncbi:MAG: hypothetical protein JWO85_568 [Candidatus Eremiobacteraeota bacterium]|nr:hypothetical protein [Candidatus Eremiobacteraeota bacterium]
MMDKILDSRFLVCRALACKRAIEDAERYITEIRSANTTGFYSLIGSVSYSGLTDEQNATINAEASTIFRAMLKEAIALEVAISKAWAERLQNIEIA